MSKRFCQNNEFTPVRSRGSNGGRSAFRDELSSLEKQTAGKLLAYVFQTQMRELSHLKKVHHYEIKDFLQMDYATKTSLDLTENARTGRSMVVFFGSWTKQKQPWEDAYFVLGSSIP